MDGSLLGLALLPVKVDIERLVQFRESVDEFLDPPRLSTDIGIPHVSIIQCPFNVSDLHEGRLNFILNRLRQAQSDLHPYADLGALYRQPKDWVFIETKFSGWINDLQAIALHALEGRIVREAIALDRDFTGYTYLEESNYRSYGYRYIGDAFRPHITLGKTSLDSEASLPKQLTAAYKSQLEARQITFDRLVSYKAGPSGSLIEVIAETNIRGT